MPTTRQGHPTTSLGRQFNGLHGEELARGPLQWTPQTHLVGSVPERGPGVHLHHHQGFVTGGLNPYYNSIPPAIHEQWGRRLHRGLPQPVPVLRPGRKEEYSMGDADHPQRDGQPGRQGLGGRRLHGVAFRRQTADGVPRPVAVSARRSRPNVGQQRHQQSPGRPVPLVLYGRAPSRVVLGTVLQDIDLIGTEDGHPFTQGDRPDRFEFAEVRALSPYGITGLEVSGGERIELLLGSGNVGAFLRGGNAYTPHRVPLIQHEGFFRRSPVRWPVLHFAGGPPVAGARANPDRGWIALGMWLIAVTPTRHGAGRTRIAVQAGAWPGGLVPSGFSRGLRIASWPRANLPERFRRRPPRCPALLRWAVGIWHETSQVSRAESTYVSMPTVGLAQATELVPVGPGSQHARGRLSDPR